MANFEKEMIEFSNLVFHLLLVHPSFFVTIDTPCL